MSKVLVGTTTFGTTAPEARRLLEEAGCEVVPNPYGKPLTEAQLLELIPGVDALVVGFDQVTEQVLQRADRLKIIAKHGIGVDTIDLEAASAAGVVVANTIGANDNAVADLAFGLMLSVARRIPEANALVKGGGWGVLTGVEVWGKTVGVVGLGRIGRGVARRARGFEMKVLAFEPYPDQAFVREQGIDLVALDELLRRSDFISLHIPLMESTRNLIGARELGLVQSDAILINTARGGVVDEDALYEALVGGRLAGAALDAFSSEPPRTSRLLELPNVIASPHMGAYSRDALGRMSLACSRAILDVLTGRRPEFVVNQDVLARFDLKGR